MGNSNPVANLEYHRKYYAEHREHLREQKKLHRRKYYKKNPDKCNLASKKWREKNKDKLDARKFERKGKYIELINEIKFESGCARCGYKDDAKRIHFHHKDPSSKVFLVSHGWHYTMSAAVAEIAKCEILCVSCHAKETESWKYKS